MSKHTPEPWEFWNERRGESDTLNIQDSCGDIIALVDTAWIAAGVDGAAFTRQTHEHNATRIVACVNALANIDDPQAFVQRVRDAVEAGAIDELYLSFIREHLKESPRG